MVFITSFSQKTKGIFMKKIFASVVFLAATILPATSAVAKDINPWKHCGIGAAIFDNNETAAALSNVIWDLGTTAVTSATVSEDTCAGENVKTAQFIDENFEALETDIAIGEGEVLSAMLNMTSSDVDTLRETLAEHSSESRNEKAQALYFAAVANG